MMLQVQAPITEGQRRVLAKRTRDDEQFQSSPPISVQWRGLDPTPDARHCQAKRNYGRCGARYLLVKLSVYLTRNSLISFDTVASPFRTSWPSAPVTRIGSVLMTLE